MNRIASLALLLAATLLGANAHGQGAHSSQQPSGGLLFYYGLVPAEVVLAHPQPHSEREMHGGARRGQSHIVLALFEGDQRVSQAEVTAHVTLAGGASVTRRLEPMTISGQPSFGGFVSVAAPGTYKIRFEARRPGIPAVASAEFEHRVESRR